MAQSFFLGHAACLVACGKLKHDKTCLPELPKLSLFSFLVCSTLTRSGQSTWQWVTNSRLLHESAAQPGRAQECWLLGLAVTTRSCFPCGCPSKAPMGDYSIEVSLWWGFPTAVLGKAELLYIFSNSSFETPLPPSVLPFASISHFYLMGWFSCLCCFSQTLIEFCQLNFVDSFITHVLCANKCSLHKAKIQISTILFL